MFKILAFRFRATRWLAHAAWMSVVLAAVAGCEGSTSSEAVKLGGSPHGLAILSSDYNKTSVALYDATTTKLVANCIDSDETGSVVKQPLSGDVVLPVGTQPNSELVTIDRKSAVLTFLAPTSCTVRAQISVSTGGFQSNPHDLIGVSAIKAYVTRYETNAAPTADPTDFDEGDDLLIVDPSQPRILGRIALTSYATPSAAGTATQARPDRGILAGGLVYVTLNSLSADFSAAGPGRVVIVDPVTDTVTGMIDLPDQTGCSGIDYVAATKRLYVACGGESSDGADQVTKSALVEIDLSGGAPVVGRVVSAASLGTQPLSYNAATVAGETAFVVTSGALDFTTGAMLAPDTAYAAPLSGDPATQLLDGGAYNLGRAELDASGKTIVLPDGDAVTPRVRTFDVGDTGLTAGALFEPDPVGHLPPREATRY